MPLVNRLEMIVFSGPKIIPSLIDPGISWIVDQNEDAERSIKPEELVQHKKVNVSDLANITTDVLCSLQQLYNSNQTQDEWVSI